MKYTFLILMVIGLAACGDTVKKSPMFLGLVGPMEWPEEHWEGQNYHPLIRDTQNAIPATTNIDRSMFKNVDSLSPNEFIEGLKSAKIIERVYLDQHRIRFSRRIPKDSPSITTVVVMPNFYALSANDQNVIGELLRKSYNDGNYLIEDSISKRIVGQINETGLTLF
jgi:hypothetical protein